MSRLPILTGVELIKILEKVGFKIIRQKGSHLFLKHQDNRTTIIPVHKELKNRDTSHFFYN